MYLRGLVGKGYDLGRSHDNGRGGDSRLLGQFHKLGDLFQFFVDFFKAVPIEYVFGVDLNDFLHLQLINFLIYFFEALVVELQWGQQVGLEAVIAGCLSSYFLRLRFVDAVSYLLDAVDKEQGGYDGPYYWPNGKMWEPTTQ